MNYTINEKRLTADEYIDFLKKTDLGVIRECTCQGIGKALGAYKCPEQKK